MSRFSHHESCPNCGSKDNLGVWTDGHKYCFGCKYYEQGITDLHKVMSGISDIKRSAHDFPYDAKSEIPTHALRWLYSCGIYQQQIDKYKVQWSQHYQLVCWEVHSPSGKYLGWQGRCFSQEAKTKYIIQGNIHDDVCILFKEDSDVYVLCEDYMSAIRISDYANAVPLFSCKISTKHLLAISNYHARR